MTTLDAKAKLTPEELAGYLLWYCGGRGCAVAYAMACKLPLVVESLKQRTEKKYVREAEGL